MTPRENAIRQHLKMIDYRLTKLGRFNAKAKNELLAKREELSLELDEAKKEVPRNLIAEKEAKDAKAHLEAATAQVSELHKHVNKNKELAARLLHILNRAGYSDGKMYKELKKAGALDILKDMAGEDEPEKVEDTKK
jgi:hypothetical protein